MVQQYSTQIDQELSVVVVFITDKSQADDVDSNINGKPSKES
jgi:hypothetical protein